MNFHDDITKNTVPCGSISISFINVSNANGKKEAYSNKFCKALELGRRLSVYDPGSNTDTNDESDTSPVPVVIDSIPAICSILYSV